MASIGAEVGQKMRSAIKAKLLELNCYVDDELPDYVMVMVANKRTKSQMKEDLQLFLSNKTSAFVDWLHIVLKKLKEVTVTNPEVYKKTTKRKSDEVPNVALKKEKKDKKAEKKIKKESTSEKPTSEESVFKSLTDDLPINANKLSEQRKIIIMKENKSNNAADLVMQDNFDIPPLSEVNLSTEEELEDIEKKIKSVKSRLGLLVESDEDDCINLKPEPDELSLDSENKIKKTEVNKPASSPPRKPERARIIFDNEESPVKRKSVLERLGKRRSSENDDNSSGKRSRIDLSDFRRDEDESSRNRDRDEEKERRFRSSLRARRDLARPKEGVLNRLGVMSKVSIPTKTPEEPEEPFKNREVPSMVKIKPRIIPHDAPQANKNLLLKAVAEAQRSIAQMPPVGHNLKPDALYTKKYKEKLQEEHVTGKKIPQAEKNKIKKILLSEEKDENLEYVPTPVDKSQDTMPKYIPSTKVTGEPEQTTTENGKIKQQFIVTLDGIESKYKDLVPEENSKPSIKSRLDKKRSPSPIIFDKVTSPVKSKPNIPDKLPIVHASPSVKNKERCKYWPSCRQGEKCEFVHPTTNCDKFPHCKFGDKCLYLHPTCKFGSSCTRRDCVYSHSTASKSLGSRITVPAPVKIAGAPLQTCKFFPNCVNVNCTFYHPRPCKFGKYCNSQLRNCDSKPNARRWTEQDKAFALSLYKRSPRLYRYLQAYFQLPSSRTLKAILAKIPFNTGINPAILEHLANQVTKMKGADRYCTLLFDEMSLCEGFHYERAKQCISGYEDIGSLGRTNKAANHALVFMIRGIRHQWKQVVAYYFTLNTVKATHLKFLIEEIISQLQTVGLNVVGTVCDQGPTNRSALNQLCAKKHPRQSPYYFFVNDHPIVTIYDVPHLLKNTRNALLKCRIQFDPQNIHKRAKFEYIESIFNFDQQKTFKSLPKLKKEHFNFKDSYVKMKVKVAAAQLRSSVAAAIETFVTFTNIIPAEAIYTAEFVQKIDYLFDSLNSSGPAISGNKPYRCALSENSPHLEFWSKLLSEMNHWKLIDLTNGTDVTNRYSFVEGWQTTIKSFNQDPLENLFSCIRQHGAANTNPTCHQFTAALKTVAINKLMMATGGDSNCENDNCMPLGDLFNLTKFTGDNLSQEVEDVPQSEISMTFKATDFADIPPEDTQGLAYIAGWVLKNIQVPDCGTCRNILYSDSVTGHHLLTSFRERDDVQRLTYASEHVMSFIQNLHDSLNDFLLKNGHKEHLENTFKEIFRRCVDFEQMNCMEHNCLNLILEKSLSFLIFKFCRDKRKQTTVSEGHRRKMRRLM